MKVVSPSDTNQELQSCESDLESSKRLEDEPESDIDHKEMMRSYACDAYLSRWLPSIKDERLPLEPTISSEEPKQEHMQEGGGTTPSQQTPTSTVKQSTAQNRQSQDAGITTLKDKASHDSGRRTYFEAIKCSPMKLRQSIAAHKGSKIEETVTVRPQACNSSDESVSLSTERPNIDLVQTINHAANEPENAYNLTTKQQSCKAAKDKRPGAKNHTSPCVVEMRSDALGQLGSLCFKANRANRRASETVYNPCNMVGGKMRRVHRNSTQNVSPCSNYRKSDLLVRCESVMIYPKTLVGQRMDKFLAKPERPREAWRETCVGSSPGVAVKHEEDYTKLPELAVTKETGAVLLDNREPTWLPDFVQNSTENHAGTSQKLHNAASTKIIIPFGEIETKQTEENREETEKVQEISTLEPKSYQIPGIPHKDKYGTNKRGYYREKKNACQNNASEMTKRRIPGIVIGITRLDIPRKTTAVSRQPRRTPAPGSPVKRCRTRVTDASELFLGGTNSSAKKSGSSSTKGQRKRSDFSRLVKGCSPIAPYEENDGCNYFLNSEGNVSLKIGGTALLKEQNDLPGDYGGQKRREIMKRKRVHFTAVVHHSRHFT